MPIRDFCMIAYYVGICDMRNYGKEEDRLFAFSKLPLFDQFARFDFNKINFEKIGGETLSFGDCSDDWEWATAFCNLQSMMMMIILIKEIMMTFANLPSALFSLIANDDGDYDFLDDDDNFDKRNYDDFCKPPWHTLLPDY